MANEVPGLPKPLLHVPRIKAFCQHSHQHQQCGDRDAASRDNNRYTVCRSLDAERGKNQRHSDQAEAESRQPIKTFVDFAKPSYRAGPDQYQHKNEYHTLQAQPLIALDGVHGQELIQHLLRRQC